MTTTAILKDGTPVRIHLFEKPAFDVEGFLVGFTLSSLNSEEYRYYQQSEFKREDRKKPNLSGYYDKKMFLKYIQNVEPVPTLDNLVKYNFKKVLATEGEEVTVTSIDFEEPYDYFYNEKKYTFNLQNTIDNRGVRNYLKPIVEDFRTVDHKINTDGANAVIVLNNQSGVPGGYFYKKNLGDFINSWSITNTQKTFIKKAMSLIIFKIREINRDIIPIIASNTHFFKKEQDVANGIIDYNDFTDLEKLLFNFKRTWGYYYNTPLDGFPRPYKDSFEALFSNSSTFEDYQSYLSSLQNFYQICYKTKNLSYYPADDKVEYLLKILSPSALNVIPYELIIKCIKQYLKFNLSQEDQRVLVKLVISINPSHANHFLDFLLEKENGAETNFQVIYDTLTDARLERYPFVNWFVDEQTNRKYFAFAIYELWKISKYNLDYIRAGTVIPHPWPYFKGVDPDNYFNINPQEFNKKNFLTFIPSSDQQIVTSQQRFESSINDKKIDITKIYKQDTYAGAFSQHKIGDEYFGSFHLYQQISFCGYESNLDLRIPKSATLPAFLFHFIEEYDRLADFDAGVALAANLTVDALLIYFTGGTSILKDLQYLKYTTKIGRALAGGIESTEAIEIWQGFRGAADIFTLTAGSLTQINEYLITTENNEAKRKILEGCQKIFISLTFLGVGLSLTAQAHAVSEAGKVLDLIEALPSGVAHGLAPEMINLLTTLKGNKNVTLTLFGNKLNALDLGDATNYIVLKYNSVFTDAQRLKFMTDFQHIGDLAFWRLLNNGKNASGIRDGSYLDNWILLSEKGLEEAKFTMYICNLTRTNDLIRYVDEPITKSIINTLSYERKLVFIDTFGNDLATFKNKPELINRWKRYYDELVLRQSFLNLEKDKTLILIDELGDLPNELFLGLKRNPSKLGEYANSDTIKRQFLRKNRDFWLANNYTYEYISSFKLEIDKVVKTYKNQLLSADIKTRLQALEKIKISEKFTLGDFIEKPMRVYLNNMILNNEDLMFSVDILFKKADGTPLVGKIHLDIDAIVVNKSINKIKMPYSAKLTPGETFETTKAKYNDAQKLEFLRNLPEDITQAKTFITQEGKKTWKDITMPQNFNQIHSIEVKYLDKSEKAKTMSLSNFKQMLKATPYSLSDFTEINPTTFNTTKEELLNSLYIRIITD
ncbi:hypothetical protein [Flavobacterium johnsoniae]|uniref:Uncharacterized protein n=1 Tax=Flavobacterium johnsoniae (strain ATCC 17061 / DSM 2064 / JCM 8514 / BCRC 14874 / CCUG 350202 / NBRC 14942 / NCIMB 11054 / UW101) TaxID=376686 RepID=A5FI73_FLAJ1|nr:hypothetical protein [Flavobacterium johnsoniae]ABQ05097.1 hypothetical protein Fjoh_2067 [Flavobacterium johnsoniae UW101]OXG00330.1 hypothetical protein B0A63_09345 [Flavobacterium johnsoniae UW101]WQG83102.1 hypothetical protein SR927_08270 [Flavobacterium johnsoniae UW101]SHL91488.1 hypothetical protein SAMN05444146_4945 [Flavobacterium johnsoniae]